MLAGHILIGEGESRHNRDEEFIWGKETITCW